VCAPIGHPPFLIDCSLAPRQSRRTDKVGVHLPIALGYDYSAALLVLMTQVTMFLISLLPGAIALVLNGPQRVDAPSQAVLRSELGINADRHVPRE
jgi:hypothetical protein